MRSMQNIQAIGVGVGPVSFEDLVRVARDGAAVELTGEALAAVDRARDVVEALAAGETPTYGVSTGFGALATRHIPTEMRAQLQRSLVRSHAAGSGPEVEREVVRALMLLRLSTLATGRTGVRRETAQLLADLLTHGITPVVREYGSLGCSGDLAPLSHCALALMGEGEVRDASGTLVPAADALAAAGPRPGRAGGQGGPGPHQRHRRHARHAGHGDHRPADAAAHRRRRGRDERRGPARHRPRLRPRAPGDPAAPRPGAVGGEPHRAHGRVRDRRLAPHRRLQPGAGRLLAALLAAGARRRPRHRRARRHGRRPRAGQRGGQPGRHRRHGGVQRQLPRRPGRLRPRLPRDRRRRRGLDQRAAYGPVPRPGPQPRAAALPGRRPRRRQRPHDRAVHPGLDRLRAQAAGGAGVRRLHPLQRDAGGPRLDGLERRAQAAPLGRRPVPRGRRRGPHRRPRARPACAADPVARHRGRSSTSCAPPASRARGPTATSRPRSRPPSASSSPARSSPPPSP